jgi:hypothetical protein
VTEKYLRNGKPVGKNLIEIENSKKYNGKYFFEKINNENYSVFIVNRT